MAVLLAVAAGNEIHVARLVAVLGKVTLLATVAASTAAAALAVGAVLGEMAGCVGLSVTYHDMSGEMGHSLFSQFRQVTLSMLIGLSHSVDLWPDSLSRG